MIRVRGARLGEKDLLAFCNELNAELGGGKDGLEFGRDESGDAWIFGINISELKREAENGDGNSEES